MSERASGFEPRELVYDDPDNPCFGCGPHNPRGLQLRFTQVGPATVECHFEADAAYCGADGVVHGGIQAVLLDEAMGMAIHAVHPAEDHATADFRLRYRAPSPTRAPLVVRATLERTEGRSHFLAGTIVDGGGRLCTEAEARWVRIAAG